MNTFTLQPVTSVWIVLFLAVCALLMMFVKPSFSKVTDGQRKTLNLLRTGVVLLALLGLLRPGCVQTEEKFQAGVLLCLLDTSRSMELPHDRDDSTRWDTIVQTMKDNQGRFKELAEKEIDVRFFGFDNEILPLQFDGEQLQLPEKPEGGETDLASPLFNSTRETRGERLIGVVLMSDGVPTVLNPPVEISQAVTPLVNMETPLFSIPLGSPADTGQSRDVAITNFAEQHVVNVKNKLLAEATLVSRGYKDQDIRVELVIIDSRGREKVVSPPTIVTPRRASEERTVRIEYKPTEPGEFRMKIRAVPMPDEIALRNNELDAFLTVNDKGLSVALIDGGMGWEQSFMRRSLATAEFLDLQFVPIYPAEREAGPRDLTELFEDDSIDVFILSNIDSRLIYDKKTAPAGLDALYEAVTERDKGLLMLGGYHSFGPGLYHQTPLAEILPIEMKSTERQDFNADIVRRYHISDELKMTPASNHRLTRLGDESVGWSNLPPLAGANRFAAVKKDALVVLESDDQAAHPLLVESSNGGRILAFAGDSLWRWNMKGLKEHARTFKPEYDKFWRQVILYLAFWDERNDESISIDFPQRRFQPKGRVRFGVAAQSITGETLTDVKYKAELTQPDGQKQLVAVTGSGPGNWSEVERDMIAQPGVYLIQVQGERNGKSLGKAQRQFVVMDRDVEKSNPVADVERMDWLAQQTSDFGGRMIEPGQLSEVLDLMIEDPPVAKVQIPTKWKFGETLGSSLGFLLMFVALLATEWVLRKKWGLV